MAQRTLPGAYVSLNDLSQLPEGQTSLTVGYVLQANRGPVNEAVLVTSPTDFLTKFTFSGKPSVSDDKTYFEILKVLSQTNSMYISRAANDPLYGGIVLQDNQVIGAVTGSAQKVGSTNAFVTVAGDVTTLVHAGDLIMISGATTEESKNKKKTINGYYNVASVAKTSNKTTISLIENLPDEFTPIVGSKAVLSQAPAKGISYFEIGAIASVTAGSGGNGAFVMESDPSNKVAEGDIITVSGATAIANNRDFTVVGVNATTKTIKVKETVTVDSSSSLGSVYYNSLVSPTKFELGEGTKDLMVITGNNPGAYNSEIGFTIDSSIDDPNMVYNKATYGFDTIRLNVINTNTGDVLETFLFSRDPDAKTIDGQSLYVDVVVSGSAYIKIINNTNVDKGLLPRTSLTTAHLHATGGSDGAQREVADLVKALEPFKSKNTPISILGCGCSNLAESEAFQTALLEVANTRTDCVAFLPSRAEEDEVKTTSSERAQAIVDYKKNTLANTSFYGTMYVPHVNVSDTYNSRQVRISACAPAIAGWLNVINNLGYPYAYAGTQNGLLTGYTCDWKIGDMGGEAELLNDASINYVAYDGKVGRYYMQTQNTLQVANSAMRNLGAVLNVLDIKEHFVTSLKEYLQLPITTTLRQDILNTATDYLDPMVGIRFYEYSFQDVSSDADIDNNTLRYLLALRVTSYAQRIYLVMNVVNSSFSFNLLQSL